MAIERSGWMRAAIQRASTRHEFPFACKVGGNDDQRAHYRGGSVASPGEAREVLQHAKDLRAAGASKPRKSGRGLWADLNISLTAEDIDSARREM